MCSIKDAMAETRDWKGMQAMSPWLLEQRIKAEQFAGEPELHAWLAARGVTGYAQSLPVMERFGYPDFLVASADELIEGQYADRLQTNPQIPSRRWCN
jgi:hypothetical protein